MAAKLRLKEILEERKLSIDELYRLIISKFGAGVEISRNTIATMVNNPDHRPNLRKLEIIAQALDLKISDLLVED